MGYIACDISSIPSEGFNWYVFILTDSWSDGLRDELARNFERLAVDTGPGVLVVKGADPEGFYSEIFNQVLVHHDFEKGRVSLPALLVSNKSLRDLKNYFETFDHESGHNPEMNVEEPPTSDDIKVALFPLNEHYMSKGSIIDFLREMSSSLRDHNSIIEKDPTKWKWLIKYFEIKPNFFGFGINFNEVISDYFSQK